jgi:hypothetical protein
VSDAPASYATRDEARVYVARVLWHPPPDGPAPVYLIHPSGLDASPAWGKIMLSLERLLPGCPLLTFRDVFTRERTAAEAGPGKKPAILRVPPVEERIPLIAAAARGAVVLPRTTRNAAPEGARRPRYLLGYAARLEALGLIAACRAVLVLAPGGLVAWPDVRVHPAGEGVGHRNPLEIDMPEAPRGGIVLPTVAASYRALGLGRPRPWRPPRPPRAQSAGTRE